MFISSCGNRKAKGGEDLTNDASILHDVERASGVPDESWCDPGYGGIQLAPTLCVNIPAPWTESMPGMAYWP